MMILILFQNYTFEMNFDVVEEGNVWFEWIEVNAEFYFFGPTKKKTPPPPPPTRKTIWDTTVVPVSSGKRKRNVQCT
jgi:hypothetical protein